MNHSPSNLSHAIVGLLAALLAVTLAVTYLFRYEGRAQLWADQWAHDLGPVDLPLKTQSAIMQRAGFAAPDLLPIYGSSEMYCCGLPFNGPVFFWHEPTGFALYAVGEPVTADLYFAQAFAALGHHLRGKKVVISDSPWFRDPTGIAQSDYDHTFSPELAMMLTFDAPISLPLREALAARMLTYPGSLAGHPMLSLGLRLLAHGSWRDVLAYELLDPLGRLEAWVAQLHDASATFTGIAALQAKGYRRNVAIHPQAIDWPAQLAAADRAAKAQASNNPFGVASTVWAKCTDLEPAGSCAGALALYHSGRNNRDGTVYPYPTTFVRNSANSAEWTDLQLELEVLRELGAQPFVYMMPLQGVYADYTPINFAVRQGMYQHFAAVTAAAGVPSTTFSLHDEDPYFVASFGHLSQRGWLYADRTLDLFWHGQLASIGRDLASGGSVEGALGDDQTYGPLAAPGAGCTVKGGAQGLASSSTSTGTACRPTPPAAGPGGALPPATSPTNPVATPGAGTVAAPVVSAATAR